jgi:hypothetical protein
MQLLFALVYSMLDTPGTMAFKQGYHNRELIVIYSL